ITRSFGLLTNAMVDALSVEPQEHVFKKNYLIAIGVARFGRMMRSRRQLARKLVVLSMCT
ncbi:hypothetical protein Tco_0560369, partial [Tanacetum coccineum]